ncbi:hypothetical protein PMAYCL1PPCAC_04404, partial [Pristionchus mayeri]
PCDAQISSKWCFLRWIGAPALLGFGVIHVGITIQRLQSTFNYGIQLQKFTSRVFIIGSMLCPCVFGYLTFSRESLEGLTPYCTSFTKSSELAMMLNLYVMVGVDMVNTLSTLALWWFNGKQLRKERGEFCLEKTFHRIQAIYAIKQFLPVTCIHSLTYIITMIVYFFSTTMGKILPSADLIFI